MIYIGFSERRKLADMYEAWLKENPKVKDCPFSVISFLAIQGRLKSEYEMREEKRDDSTKKS